MQEDFNVKSYKEFRTLLEADELLDKAPGPRIRGELSRKASKVNIDNAVSLNNWARLIGKELTKSTALSNRAINFIPVDDWIQGTAAILEIDLSDSDLLDGPELISVLVYDSSDIRVQLPEQLSRLMRFKNSKKQLRSRNAATVFLSRVVNKALS